ncbi:MAG: ABC transporter permease [Betaproteobacteria bacterium HGW-Betaproteobacteria-15]|jgi:ABC-type nitrate/sulfonate/bicarbonate transport system permease component|nr:MAG: ABC transporter permease [Betaproteobacteria bacterium HGW-Betaproteobacteria-15]
MNPKLLMRGLDAATSLLVTLGLLGLWWLVTRQEWVSAIFLPGPQATWGALREGLLQGELLRLTLGTVERMAYGWALASAIGIALGALIGISPALRAWLQPMLELIRPLPASAVVPVAIALIGLSPAMVLIVIAFGAVWPVLLATVHGFASIEPRLHEVSRVLRLSPLAFIFKIGLPNALPDALAGMRISLTVSLILAIVGEMLASQEGLGQAILLAARSFRSAELFAGVALLGLIGFVSNALLSWAEHRVLRWKQP